MKKGNFRIKKIYPEKGIFRFVIQARVNNIWKNLDESNQIFIFEKEEEAKKVLMAISNFASAFNEKINQHGIDVENLKTRG